MAELQTTNIYGSLSVLGTTTLSGDLKMDTNKSIFYDDGAGGVYGIYPYRTGLDTLTGAGSIPHPGGMTIESDALIAFIETDNDAVRGWMDLDNNDFYWSGGITVDSGADHETLIAGGNITLQQNSPQLAFKDIDQTAPGNAYWLHVNSGHFYILQDKTGSGTWDSPHPLQITSDNRAVFGGSISVMGASDYGGALNVNGEVWINSGIVSSYDEDLQLQRAGTTKLTLTSTRAHFYGSSSSDEIARFSHDATDGNPYISFYQDTTRRSFIQHQDSHDRLRIVSEYGQISFQTGTGGTEVERVNISSSGNVYISSSLQVGSSGSVITRIRVV